MKRSPAIAATGVTFAVGRLLLRTYFILGLLRICPPSFFVRCVVISFCSVYNMSPYIAAFVARSFILESPLLQTFQKQAPSVRKHPCLPNSPNSKTVKAQNYHASKNRTYSLCTTSLSVCESQARGVGSRLLKKFPMRRTLAWEYSSRCRFLSWINLFEC